MTGSFSEPPAPARDGGFVTTASGLERFAPLSGVIAVGLLVVVFSVSGNPPDIDAPVREVVSYYQDHDGREQLSSALLALAGVFLLFFASSLRTEIRRSEDWTSSLSSLALSGGVVAAGGLMVAAGIHFALADSADEGEPLVTKTLNTLDADFFFPFLGGLAIMLISAGLAVVRTAALPKWLGWVALVLGIACLTPARFLAFVATGAWILAVSVLLFSREAAREAAADSLWDLAPRLREMRHFSVYLKGVRLWRRVFRGNYTMLSCRRGRTLYRLAARVEQEEVPGALVDCGVWNGGSTALLSAGAPSREVWAFDSFEGLPEPGPLDGPESAGWGGELVGSEEMVKEAFRRFVHPGRLRVVKGWFQDTFPQVEQQIGEVAVLHADGDWYESVLLTLETFYPRMPRGAYVVIDDYGHWQGAQRATDEFRASRGISARLAKVDYSGVWWRKP